MTQSKSTRQPDEEERRAKIDAAIEASVKPSPDSANIIAELLGEHRTMVARRYHRRWIMLGGRWVRRNEGDE